MLNFKRMVKFGNLSSLNFIIVDAKVVRRSSGNNHVHNFRKEHLDMYQQPLCVYLVIKKGALFLHRNTHYTISCKKLLLFKYTF